ncbi:daptide-type RiPP [Clavibacter michiganensis]|nr:daptide-type RiPP [Clavibacter michiganensis]
MEMREAFSFEEIDTMDAPSDESFWNGMWLGIGYVGAMAALLT